MPGAPSSWRRYAHTEHAKLSRNYSAGKSQDRDLIFCTPSGTPLDRGNVVKRDFWPLLKQAGMRGIRFDDLRHTYATLLIAQGESPKYIQAQMGHASIQGTMDRYGHRLPDVNQQAACPLENR
jgi:integrase